MMQLYYGLWDAKWGMVTFTLMGAMFGFMLGFIAFLPHTSLDKQERIIAKYAPDLAAIKGAQPSDQLDALKSRNLTAWVEATTQLTYLQQEAANAAYPYLIETTFGGSTISAIVFTLIGLMNARRLTNTQRKDNK